jgi:hypothetical protein
MNTTDIDQLIQNLESGVANLAKSTLQDYEAQAKSDGENAINNLKTNLEQWTVEAENDELTAEDLTYLLKEEGSLDEMTALKQAGLADVRIEEFKNNLVGMITNSVFSLVKI